MDLLKSLSKDNTVQYILTMIDDMLTGEDLWLISSSSSCLQTVPSFFFPANPERVRLFHTREQEGFLFSPLLKCLERDDEYIMQKANKVITGIIWFAPPFLPLFLFFFFFSS